jgi:hypothetical protein
MTVDQIIAVAIIVFTGVLTIALVWVSVRLYLATERKWRELREKAAGDRELF